MHLAVKKKITEMGWKSGCWGYLLCLLTLLQLESVWWLMIGIPQGPKPEDQAAAGAGGAGSVADGAASAQASSTPGVSNDKYRNYGVLAGLVTAVGAFGWYSLSKDKKAEEVQDWSIS